MQSLGVNRPWLLWIALIGLVLRLPSEASAGAITWRSDFSAAKREAMLNHKLILVNIHASWCGPCKLLQSTTLKNPKLVERIQETCVPLGVDADLHPELIELWSVNSFPTQLFLAPNGQVISRIVGYVGAPEYQSSLELAVDTAGIPRGSHLAKSRVGPNAAQDRSAGVTPPKMTFQDPVNASPPARVAVGEPAQPLPGALTAGDTPLVAGRPSGVTLAPPPPPPAVNVKVPAPARDTMDKAIRPCDVSLPVAMDGFCPVSMIVRAELTHGSDNACLAYKGRRYLFRGEAERSMFQNNPERFLPAENGLCVVTWAEEHRWIPGQIRYPAIFGDHVFFFNSETVRQKFLDDPERYVDSAGRAYRSSLGNLDRNSPLR